MRDIKEICWFIIVANSFHTEKSSSLKVKVKEDKKKKEKPLFGPYGV